MTAVHPVRILNQSSQYSFQRGTHSAMYDNLGAHPAEYEGTQGVRFAVWAPNARQVSVLCDQNSWTNGKNTLYPSESGVWAGFVPHMKTGDAYKYGIESQEGQVFEKADPYAFYAEQPPKTASVVHDIDQYEWQDEGWLQAREQTEWFKRPINVYEVQLGSWKRPTDGRKYFNYKELAHELVAYVKKMGFTHLELLPICEYPFDGSWGYQSTGYFAPTSRFGTPDDFQYFVDYCHQNQIGVIIDWVPAHFPTDGHALGNFDGTALYEHADPRQGFHPDWNTFIFNYSRNEVRDFLLSSARFWLDKYHIDGIRVDAVASMLYLDYSREDGEWIPNEFGGRENLSAISFMKDMNTALHAEFPGVLTIAEESTAWGGVSRPVYDGGLGFSIKWDMGWMNDTLRYMHNEPVHRKYHQHDLSFRMIYAFSENFMLPLSHDEVVHGKGSLINQMTGDYWQKFANLRLLFAYQYCMPGKNLLFMGSELAQWEEWNHDTELDWGLIGNTHHDGISNFVGDLNRLSYELPAMHQRDFQSDGFSWIQADDSENSVFAFCRHGEEENELVVCVFNFTPVVRYDYRIGVPYRGTYQEVLNSDAEIYGGTNVGNQGGTKTTIEPMHGHEQSLELTLPPLGAVVMRFEG